MNYEYVVNNTINIRPIFSAHEVTQNMLTRLKVVNLACFLRLDHTIVRTIIDEIVRCCLEGTLFSTTNYNQKLMHHAFQPSLILVQLHLKGQNYLNCYYETNTHCPYKVIRAYISIVTAMTITCYSALLNIMSSRLPYNYRQNKFNLQPKGFSL